jgi:CRP/FNR family transcriptional regulator, cyclic AMP receptor protein
MMDNRSAATASILQFLSSQSLFEGISTSSLVTFSKGSRLKPAPKGSFIFFQHDPADAVYVVWRGVIAIRLENPDGRELVINEMGVGDCFGELGILTGEPRSASAEAIVDSEVLLIPSFIFKSALDQEPLLASRLLEITARRLQNSSKREEALAFYDAQQRLAQQLVNLDQQSRDKGYLTLSQEELATRVGLTRQTVAAILGRWRRSGWLLTGRGHIVLLNLDELNLLAQSQSIDRNESPVSSWRQTQA